MKTLLAAGLLVLAASHLMALSIQETPQSEAALEQHRWLEQLLGEWTVSYSATMEPGADPVLWTATESVRSIGGLWVVAEGSALSGHDPFTSLLTIGYDSGEERFVGTWIDSMQTTLWTYVGSLDEEKQTLTLEAEGPSMFAPGETVRYRDHFEILGPGHRRLTSTAQDENGDWVTYMTSEAKRHP